MDVRCIVQSHDRKQVETQDVYEHKDTAGGEEEERLEQCLDERVNEGRVCIVVVRVVRVVVRVGGRMVLYREK